MITVAEFFLNVRMFFQVKDTIIKKTDLLFHIKIIPESQQLPIDGGHLSHPNRSPITIPVEELIHRALLKTLAGSADGLSYSVV